MFFDGRYGNLHTSSFLESAFTRFLEADQATTRERLLTPRIRPFQKQVAGHFTDQGAAFLRRFESLRSEVDATAVAEAVSQSDWQPLWNQTARETFAGFSGDTETAILDALIMGGGQLFDAINTDAGELGINWNLQNPRAVAFSQQQAAATVTNINDTTRSYLNSLITQATNEGMSYGRLAQAIEAKFSEFATGGDNPRSRRVAVYELGNGYEAGNSIAAAEMETAGVDMEKKWITIGDDRVRPSHRDSQGEGWQALDYVFASGAERSPSDPGCRCVMIYRRKKS